MISRDFSTGLAFTPHPGLQDADGRSLLCQAPLADILASMNEADWHSCTDPQRMLQWLRHSGTATERKARLFGCACCRRIWHLLTDEGLRAAVDVTEQYADGLASKADMEAAMAKAREVDNELVFRLFQDNIRPPTGIITSLFRTFQRPSTPAKAIFYGTSAVVSVMEWRTLRTPMGRILNPLEYTAEMCRKAVEDYAGDEAGREEERAHCALLRCPFGRPTPAIAPAVVAWQDRTVVRLAQRIYEERMLPSGHLDPDRMVVLADALQEGGCDNEEVVAHCRQGGVHVRGCWVIDFLLAKS
jgi:hypothetical protein